ncbi:hypothetical protein VTP01DRAFT_8090 [Rhizomucor pusillus]|uniref:uncharacterized protein n=1 Tax=Rhizomucor pusillus TaxID=4840 RepID=UPI0037433CB3
MGPHKSFFTRRRRVYKSSSSSRCFRISFFPLSFWLCRRARCSKRITFFRLGVDPLFRFPTYPFDPTHFQGQGKERSLPGLKLLLVLLEIRVPACPLTNVEGQLIFNNSEEVVD